MEINNNLNENNIIKNRENVDKNRQILQQANEL